MTQRQPLPYDVDRTRSELQRLRQRVVELSQWYSNRAVPLTVTGNTAVRGYLTRAGRDLSSAVDGLDAAIDAARLSPEEYDRILADNQNPDR